MNIMTLTILRRILNISRDILWACLYFRTSDIPYRKNRIKQGLGFLMLTALFFMYTAEDGGLMANAWVRLLWRTGCCFLYLFFTRKLSPVMALFDSLVYSVVIIINHNFLLTPATRPLLLMSAPIVPDEFWNSFLCFTISFLFPCFIFLIVQKWMPLRMVQSVGILELTTFLLIALCAVETNAFLRVITDNTSAPIAAELSVILSVLNALMLACIIFVVQLQNKLRQNAAVQIQLARTETELNNANHRKQFDNRIRQLRHDTNNHLSTLRYLISNGQQEKALNYVDSFLERLPEETINIHSGNPLLDSLIAEKFTKAESRNTETMITADLRPLNIIKDFDLCTIFGNALDNAIEACEMVKDCSERYIYIRGKKEAGHMIITIINSVEPSLPVTNHQMHTTKNDPENHGFGMNNMRRTVQKYGGVMLAEFDQTEPQFRLTLMIPIEPN